MPGARLRVAALLLFCAFPAPAWVESVEFPWNALPKSLWETKLVWLKNIGVSHVSLPPAPNSIEQLMELIRSIRALDLEADLEGPVPESLKPFLRAHGGPLTEPLPSPPARLSVLAPDALLHSRKLLTSGRSGLIWTDVEDTIGDAGYRAGAVGFLDEERAALLPVRRNAQIARYWGPILSGMREVPGASPKIPGSAIAAQRFVFRDGVSFVSVVNSSAKTWTGEIGTGGPLKTRILLSNVAVPAHDSLWLPVNVALTAGPLCRDCNAFATVDRLVSATAELTAMEYENGILAMEFSAPAAGEAILQLSREPSGPLVAGGRPTAFDWDEKTQRLRLPIPAGSGPGHRVRIGLAIEAPDATAFFSSARVLLLGETNDLTAEFSSESIAQRSRLRLAPGFQVTQYPGGSPLEIVYRLLVPPSAIHGDHTDISIEADGERMSHVRPELLRPATLRFTDAISVRVAPNSTVPIRPAAIPVNTRSGRDVTLSIANHAPEIRTFRVSLTADGLEFSPESLEISIGASASRDVSFRVFARGAAAGMHPGQAVLTRTAPGSVTVSEAARIGEPVRFLVLPPNVAIAWSFESFAFLESPRTRASFLPGRWLEFIDKESGQGAIPAGGAAFPPGPMEARGDTLVVAGQKTFRMQDLEQLAPKPRR